MIVSTCKKKIYLSLYSPKGNVWLSTTKIRTFKKRQDKKTPSQGSKQSSKPDSDIPQVLEYLTGNLITAINMLKALIEKVDSMQDQMVMLEERGKL